MSNKISHSGIIEHILDDCIKVRIVQTSACAACKVASHCNASESKVKIVDVFCSDNSTYQVGQEVVVWASKDVANKALLLGFGIPFLLLICVLLIALIALVSLVPYYLVLWLLRQKIQRQIAFHIGN